MNNREQLNDSGKHDHVALIAWGLLVLAFVVRVMALGRADLWGDEILFAQRSSPPLSLGEVLTAHWKNFPQMPYLPLPSMIQNVVLHLLQSLTGGDVLHHAAAQRLPSALFGSATVPIFYLLARRLLNARTALMAAAMLCFFYFPNYYSREARFYAQLLFFTVLTAYFFVRVLQTGRLGRGSAVGLAIGSFGASQSMMPGLLFPGALFGLTLLSVLSSKQPEPLRTEGGRRVLWGMLISIGVGLLPIVPFALEYLTEGMALAPAETPSLPVLLNDLFGHMFMGATTTGLMVTWLFLLTGILFFLRRGEWVFEHRLLALATGLVFLVTLITTLKNQYYNPRTFYSITAFVYLFFATGLVGSIHWLGAKLHIGERVASRLVGVLAAALIGLHAVYFVPLGWSLKARANNYGEVARWLNTNLPPNTPYLLESAYQMRFVGNFYEVPGHVGATPYVHGPGKGEMAKLRRFQRAFLEQFPETYYVASALHQPIWEWPDEYFAQKEVIENHPLRRLYALGLMGASYNNRKNAYWTPIYYNTRDDLRLRRRAMGRPVLPDWSDWKCLALGRQPDGRVVYARAVKGPRGTIGLEKLQGGEVVVELDIRGAVQSSSESCEVVIQGNNKILGGRRVKGGTFWALKTEPIALRKPLTEITVSVPSGRETVLGVIIQDLQYRVIKEQNVDKKPQAAKP